MTHIIPNDIYLTTHDAKDFPVFIALGQHAMKRNG